MRGLIIAGWLEHVGLAERWLAVIGGGLVGGLLIGFLTGVLVRLLSTRKMPRGPRNVVRLTGAVLCGWVVALLLYSGSGGGGGDGRWWMLGSQGGEGRTADTGKGDTTAKAPWRPGTTTAKTPDNTPAAETLRVEVLGPAALEKLPGKPDTRHCYRVEGEEGPKLLTLKEVEDFIRRRQKRQPPLRCVVLVVYNDSPALDKEIVTELRAWARDLPADGGKMKVTVDLPDEAAPIR
jgi:hypothetical protein